MRIYIPSQLGDIELSPAPDNTTQLVYDELTNYEKDKLAKFLENYSIKLELKGTIIIPEGLAKAHKKFMKVFKAGKSILTVIKLKDGKLELTKELSCKDFEAAVSVEKPKRGCPMPTLLERAETRAQKVLTTFLSSQQQRDFDKHKCFIAKGNYSGYPYLVISRWNPKCQIYGLLWCIPTGHRVCASLDDLPPSEEILAMKFSVEFDERKFLN